MFRRNQLILIAAAVLAVAAALAAVQADTVQADPADDGAVQYLPAVIRDDLSTDGDFRLLKDTFVNEDVTLTINGSLDLNGKNLFVYGTFVVNGVIHSSVEGAGSCVELRDGSEVRIDGFGASLSAESLDVDSLPQFRYQTGGGESDPVYSYVVLVNVADITLDATRRASDMSDRMLCISSDSRPSVVGAGEAGIAEPTITVGGPVTVAEGTELVLEGMTVVSSQGGALLTEGRLWTVGSTLSDYVGSSYSGSVSVDGSVRQAECYTTFEDAFSSGADVSVRGGHVFEGDITLDGGRTLFLDPHSVFGEEPVYSIPDGSTFKVASGSRVTPLEQGFNSIGGTLKVSTDSDYVPAEGTYADSWIDGGYRVYSGTEKEGGANIFAYIGGALVLIAGVLLGIYILRRYH